MSATVEDHQAAGRLLLAARARRAAPRSEQVAEFDWKTPHCLSPAQRAELARRADRSAKEISAALGRLLQTPLVLSPGALTEQYTVGRSERQGSDATYSVSAASGGVPAGSLSISAGCAADWVAGMLGGQARGTPGDRELSVLEAALLGDVMAAVAASLSKGLGLTARPLTVDGAISKGDSPVRALVCVVFPFRIEGQDRDVVTALVELDHVEAALGCGAGRSGPAGANAGNLRAHIERVALRLSARIGAQIATRDVLTMEPGDVLVMPLGQDVLAEILVEGRVLLSGQLARRDGHLALRVVPRAAS